jgi:hypothetical protein
LILLEIRLGTLCAIGRFLLQHMVDNFGEFRGRGRRGFRWPEFARQATIERAEVTRTRPQTLRGQAPGATRPILDAPPTRREHFAATHLVIGTAPQPGRKMLVRRPFTHIEADF